MKNKDNKKSTGKKIAKGIFGALGIGLTIYTIKEVAKEYDSVVDKYNDLVDKYNENVDFIQSCDFYEVKDSVSDKKKDEIKNDKLSKVTETKDRNGVVRKETFDPITGFTVVEVKEDPNNALDEDFNKCKDLNLDDIEVITCDNETNSEQNG